MANQTGNRNGFKIHLNIQQIKSATNKKADQVCMDKFISFDANIKR